MASDAAPAAAASSGAGPFSRLEWMIAWRYLRARRREGVISVIAGFSLAGITLGVATLIIVMAVMNGFRVELIDRIVGAQAHVTVLPYDRGNLEGYDALAADVASVPGVVRAAPVIEKQVPLSGPSGNAGALLRGMAASDIRQLSGVSDPEAAQGSLDRFEEGIAIGAGVARTLGLALGDRVTLLNPRGTVTAFGVIPKTKAYEVVYIFRIGMSQFDNALVFLPLEEAQTFFNMPDRVDQIEVMVEDPDTVADPTAQSIAGTIDDRILSAVGDRGFLWSWKRANGSFIAALDVERAVMFIILSLIILVAALNIISGLIMLVKDKGRDIAILRTMGLSKGAVLRVFFICGAFIGVVGTVVGCLLGVLFVVYIQEIQAAVEWVMGGQVWDPQIRFLTRVPAHMVPSDVIITVTIALSLSFFATWYPARRAARMDPVEALRHE
ncbi:MAG: lipoprotein-releasing ABC transporter permease subunit [Pseudomonadota bacterium]